MKDPRRSREKSKAVVRALRRPHNLKVWIIISLFQEELDYSFFYLFIIQVVGLFNDINQNLGHIWALCINWPFQYCIGRNEVLAPFLHCLPSHKACVPGRVCLHRNWERGKDVNNLIIKNLMLYGITANIV